MCDMNTTKTSLLRALCAVVVGALLIKYREQTVQWMTVAIGGLFLLSGVISCIVYFNAIRQTDVPKVFDAQGRQLTAIKPAFPLVGIGSVILGLLLALMPNTFVHFLVYILSALLILGALNQFVVLVAARRLAYIGLYFWIMPTVIFFVGIVALFFPSAIASAPIFVIGWCMLLYGVVEAIHTIKIAMVRSAAVKAGLLPAEEANETTTEETDDKAEDEAEDKADDKAENKADDKANDKA